MHVIEEFLSQPVAPWYYVFIFYILHPKEEKMPPTDNLHSPFHPTPYKYVGMQPKKIDILDSNATCR